jgi:DNA mismatch repair ATPase MutS
MAHGVLQLLVLWDFHVLAALERWQQASGAHARDWLAALGEAEALSALATLAHDNPHWSMPELVEGGEARIDARSLGHPLIPARTRVSNDVTVGPPGTFVLVTGSNMSGKSTLLRAIGTNVILAQAGGPVCAAALHMTPMHVWTSIRIDDSLEAGVSLFMAELKRLKRIVDSARDPGRTRSLLYLLDEILHGTNTAERRIAARRVINTLVKAGAIGAVTTHDLTLAEDPSLDAAARRVHFTERFEVNEGVTSMTFDYRLRPGLATSANALKLLEMIGLGDGAGGDTPRDESH